MPLSVRILGHPGARCRKEGAARAVPDDPADRRSVPDRLGLPRAWTTWPTLSNPRAAPGVGTLIGTLPRGLANGPGSPCSWDELYVGSVRDDIGEEPSEGEASSWLVERRDRVGVLEQVSRNDDGDG